MDELILWWNFRIRFFFKVREVGISLIVLKLSDFSSSIITFFFNKEIKFKEFFYLEVSVGLIL